jgi:hypothetical protein
MVVNHGQSHKPLQEINSLGAEEPLRDEVPGPGNILDKILPLDPRGAPAQRSLI